MQRTSSISRAIYHSLSATIFDAIGAIASRVTFDRDSLIGECVRE
ncbi:unnamed protein product, partial [Anisakis simplex]|uniref:Transcriptional regulator n=1 Tax=Anisakis simplex TaxID=6269 RepID=A0A0M3JNV1_ANISI